VVRSEIEKHGASKSCKKQHEVEKFNNWNEIEKMVVNGD
jgi:hypothetical protein